METVSMLVAGLVLITAIYGLTGMLFRRPTTASQETEVRSQ